MRKIIKLEGVHVDNDALPIVAASEEERTLASIPGLFFWLQGGPQFASGTDLRDRAGGRLVTSKSPGTAWTQGTFANGAPALIGPNGTSSSYDVGGAEFALDRWSIAMVVNIPSGASGNDEVTSYPESLSTGAPLVPRIGFNSSKEFTIREGMPAERMREAGTAWVDNDALLLATFSVQRGISFFVNGDLTRHVADYRPLGDGKFHLGAQGLPQSSGGFSGRLGHLMLFNEDLSSVENTGYRRVLERILMDHYGIS